MCVNTLKKSKNNFACHCNKCIYHLLKHLKIFTNKLTKSGPGYVAMWDIRVYNENKNQMQGLLEAE